MKYRQIHPALRAALAYHEAFRRLGFPADDIYVRFAEKPQLSGVIPRGLVQVVLKAQGKNFTCDAGIAASLRTEEAFAEAWKSAVEAWNGGKVTKRDMEKIWEESEPRNEPISFVLAIKAKGIVPPNASF